MDVVDSDRAAEADETGGYAEVTLTSLRPLDCTPKNNVIVGVRREHVA